MVVWTGLYVYGQSSQSYFCYRFVLLPPNFDNLEIMAPQTSAVWKYYDIISDHAQCKICKTNFSRKGRGTGNLRTHLKSKHPEEHKELLETESKKSEQTQMQATPSSSLVTDGKPKQQTIVRCLENKIKWKKNDARTKSMDQRISEMIVLDDLPFSHVEDKGFCRVMAQATPQYELKQRRFYRDIICEDIYPAVESKILAIISSLTESSKVSFTTDAWSDNTSGVSLLSLTCHAIDEHFQRQHFVLCAEPLSERHTGEYLSTVFNTMLDKWNIEGDDVHCVVRDAGANMKKALFLSEIKNVDCFAHQIQLVVKKGISAQKGVSDLLSKCRSIATHFNHSAVAQDELKKIQSRLNVSELSVVQDVPTRWNSSLHMLERMSKINEAVCLYATTNTKVKPLTASDNEILNKCIACLKPFDEVTKTISSADSSLADVIPLTATMKTVLRNVPNIEGVSAMRDTLILEISNRFDSLQKNDAYVTATFLDPRYKSKFLEPHALQRVKTNLGHMCDEKLVASREKNKKKIKTSETESPSHAAASTSSASIKESMSILLASSSDDEIEAQMPKEVTKMLEDYLKGKRLEPHKDPLTWWHDNGKTFPLLAELARTHLACPSTSVASERLFSGAGLIYDEKRSKLSPERAQKLLFLKHNLPIVKFEY